MGNPTVSKAVKALVITVMVMAVLKMGQGFIEPKLKNFYLDLFYDKSKIETMTTIDSKKLEKMKTAKVKTEETMFGTKTISNDIIRDGHTYDKEFLKGMSNAEAKLHNASQNWDKNMSEIESFVGLIWFGAFLYIWMV
jgi:hypothetical protein